MSLARCPHCDARFDQSHYPGCPKLSGGNVEQRLRRLERDSHPPVDIDAVVERALKRHGLISVKRTDSPKPTPCEVGGGDAAQVSKAPARPQFSEKRTEEGNG